MGDLDGRYDFFAAKRYHLDNSLDTNNWLTACRYYLNQTCTYSAKHVSKNIKPKMSYFSQKKNNKNKNNQSKLVSASYSLALQSVIKVSLPLSWVQMTDDDVCSSSAI